MRNFNRVASNLALGISFGLGLGLLAGDAAPDTHATAREQALIAQQKAAAHAEWLQDTRQARRAIATRYGSCAVTSVVDHHKAARYEDVQADKLRDQVDITVEFTKTPEAVRVEKAYDKDDSVLWMPPDVMARERVPGQHGVNALGTTIPGPSIVTQPPRSATSVTRPIYPYADRTSGNVGIFMSQDVETNDHTGLRHYEDFGATYCGTIVLRQQAGGGFEWQVDPSAEPMDNILRQRGCELVPDPTQPNVFSSQC